jgi:hypothetical protein
MKNYSYLVAAMFMLFPSAIVPAIAAPISQQSQLDRTVIPGRKVGGITKATTRADLVKLFGASRLKDETTRFFGGDAEFPGTVVQLGTERSLTVLWKDAKRTKISGVMINDAQWKTSDGIGVGTTLNQLRKKFGEFQFSGFGWDYGGIPQLPTSSSTRKLTLRLSVSDDAYQKHSQAVRAVSGEGKFSSKDARLQNLGVHVGQMLFFFD